MKLIVVGAIGLGLAISLTGCAVYDSMRTGGRQAVVDGIEASFPVLERLAVTVLIAGERCDHLVYVRGA